ncbi:hypothetical protein ScPMuIL_013336 [Solemya velum]
MTIQLCIMALLNTVLFGWICLLFLLSGGAKLAGLQLMKDSFVVFSGVFPLKSFGIIPDPDVYRLTIGVVEFLGAIILMLGPVGWKKLTYVVFFVIMVGAVHTLIMTGESHMAPFPASTGAILLYLYSKSGGHKKID